VESICSVSTANSEFNRLEPANMFLYGRRCVHGTARHVNMSGSNPERVHFIENSLLGRTSRGRSSIEFGQFTSKKRVFWKFRDELLKLYAGQFWLLFA
jgi:hypothetical protein